MNNISQKVLNLTQALSNLQGVLLTTSTEELENKLIEQQLKLTILLERELNLALVD